MWLKPIPTAGAEHVPQRHADTATHDSVSSVHYPSIATQNDTTYKYGNLFPLHLNIKMATKTSTLHLLALLKVSRTVHDAFTQMQLCNMHVSLHICIYLLSTK
jgi:hypothetical protein